MNTLSKFSVITLTTVTSLVIVTTVFAVNLPPQAASRGASQATIARQAAQTRLQDAKLKSCQARENAIKQRSSSLTQLVTTMEEKFDRIEKRVEDYYNSKVVSSGKTVSNYASLISDIQTKKAAVPSALTKAQNDVTDFSCTSDNPKVQMTQFRVDMQSAKAALKDYRTSIKNLIVAVHSVTGEQNKSPESSKSGGNK